MLNCVAQFAAFPSIVSGSVRGRGGVVDDPPPSLDPDRRRNNGQG